MHQPSKKIVCSVIILATFYIHTSRCARVKEFVQEKAATCSTLNSNQYVIKFPGPLNITTASNIVRFYGNFTVTETIQEPLELAVIPNRCTMDMKTCELFNKVTLSNVCRYINDDKGLWASFFKSVEPDLRCPIKPGVYKFENSVVDLAFFVTFPLEGYRWQTSIKLYSKNQSKKELYCLSSQSSMRWVKKS